MSKYGLTATSFEEEVQRTIAEAEMGQIVQMWTTLWEIWYNKHENLGSKSVTVQELLDEMIRAHHSGS